MSATVSKAVGDAATSDPEEPRRERALVVVREGGQAAPDGEKDVLHGVTGFLRRAKPYQRVPVETVVIAIEQLTERLDVSPPRPIEDVSPRRTDCDRLGLVGCGPRPCPHPDAQYLPEASERSGRGPSALAGRLAMFFSRCRSPGSRSRPRRWSRSGPGSRSPELREPRYPGARVPRPHSGPRSAPGRPRLRP